MDCCIKIWYITQNTGPVMIYDFSFCNTLSSHILYNTQCKINYDYAVLDTV